MPRELTKVGIYGIGHFGYAIMRHLCEKVGNSIELRGFDRNEQVRAVLRHERRHPLYATTTPLDECVQIVNSVEDLVADVDLLVLAVASASLQEAMEQVFQQGWENSLPIVNLAKALDFKTGRRLSEVLLEMAGQAGLSVHYMALAGGTIAGDLLLRNPLGVTLAGVHEDTLLATKQIFSSSKLWVQTSFDLTGVEYAAAFKNAISICAGVAQGLGLSYGSETHLISRMAEEVEKFCVHRLGADPRTFQMGSQCWGNDLWMSCTGNTRNRAFGELIGQGANMEEAIAAMQQQHKTIEGIQTLQALSPLVARYPSDLRLLTIAEKVILQNESPQLLIDALMRDEETLPSTESI